MTGRIVLLGSVTGYIESFHQQSQSQYGDTAHYRGTVSVSYPVMFVLKLAVCLTILPYVYCVKNVCMQCKKHWNDTIFERVAEK